MRARTLSRLAPALLAAALALTPMPAAAWDAYQNPAYGYAIDLPGAPFAVEATPGGVTLLELGGRGQIDVYGAENAAELSPREFEAALAEAPRIRDISYSRRGNSWFVISGHYVREGDAEAGLGDDLIFYAKVMFSPDRSRFSAFEASYPVADKARFDPIITRLEASLRAPANAP